LQIRRRDAVAALIASNAAAMRTVSSVPFIGYLLVVVYLAAVPLSEEITHAPVSSLQLGYVFFLFRKGSRRT